MAITARVAEFLVGFCIVLAVIDAAVRTFVLPRPAGVTLTRIIATTIRKGFSLLARESKSYESRDRIMALYGPITLLSFSVAWLAGTGAGYALMFHAVAGFGWRESIRISGSALLTLGFVVPSSGVTVALVFTEAALGLVLVALLISYLPTIYGAFSRREVMVSQFTVRAGSPPQPTELFIRAHRAGFLHQFDEMFDQWQLWFVELEETHTSLSILPFFRSPNGERNWLTAAGAILDTAAIYTSSLDVPFTPSGAICIRAGFFSLRSIASFFGLPFDPDPAPDQPISIAKEEFFAVYDELAAAGVALRPDRDQCWRDFAGWRVNYDAVLIQLAGMVMAPYAPWISDRSLRTVHPSSRSGSR